MSKKRLLISFGVSCVVALMIGLLSWETISAQECRLVRVHGRSEHPSLTIEPQTSFISKGDCVVWFNRVFTDEIEIMFEEDKRCLDVTQNPQGAFTLDAKSCFVSTWIPFASTSNLRFMEKGTYDYVVKAKNWKGIQAKGQIIVE